jgi:hypothetical protein
MIKDDTWIDEALTGFDPERAARYRDCGTYLDRALEGVDDRAKINALRVMVNTGADPNDVTNVMIGIFGHTVNAIEVIPRLIDAATAKLDKSLERASEEFLMFPDVVSEVSHRVADEIAAEAMSTARAAVRTAGLEEVDLVRLRVALVAEEGLKRMVDNAFAEKKLLATDFLITKARVIAALCACAVLVFGWVAGATWGTFHAHLSSDQKTQITYGREFIQMYPNMPDAERSWIASYVKSHPIETQ